MWPLHSLVPLKFNSDEFTVQISTYDIYIYIYIYIGSTCIVEAIFAEFAGAIARSYSQFGRGDGTVLLNGVQCSGDEENVVNCTHGGIGVVSSSCNHGTDAGVECPGQLEYMQLVLQQLFA